MFKKSQEELKALGAHITTAEIKQQPELWVSTFGIYQEKMCIRDSCMFVPL